MNWPGARHWFVHTCTKLAPNSATDGKGLPTYTLANQTTFKARVEKVSKLVRTPDGKEVHAANVLLTDELIKSTDYVWLPAIAGETADDTASLDRGRRPLTVETVTDRPGFRFLCRAYFA